MLGRFEIPFQWRRELADPFAAIWVKFGKRHQVGQQQSFELVKLKVREETAIVDIRRAFAFQAVDSLD